MVMENQHILLLAAGAVLLYFLWLQCSNEHYVDEGFRAARKAANAVGNAGKAVGKAGKKAGKAVGKAVSGKGKKGHKGRDMTGLTFVCKAVDFGPSMMGPMGGAPLPGAIPVAGGKKGGKGKKGGAHVQTRPLV